jgi:hypothetical protein
VQPAMSGLGFNAAPIIEGKRQPRHILPVGKKLAVYLVMADKLFFGAAVWDRRAEVAFAVCLWMAAYMMKSIS